MTQSRQCPKCAGTMVDGFIVDNTHGGATVAKWVEGEPKKSFWIGLNLSGADKVEITTWCCRRCGYLESYAAPE